MKIGMIAPLELRVPPVAYGGTEMIVHLLTEELVRRGHDVTLYASGDSITNAKLVSVTPTFLRKKGRDTRLLTTLSAMSCFEKADDFDVIHNHTLIEGMAGAGVVKTPVLTTFHGALSGDDLELFQFYKGWYNTISRSAKSALPPKDGFTGVVYNAIDCSSYPFNDGPREEFLLYYSRISPEKGTHIAIQVARRVGLPLVISGNLHPKDEAYFLTKVLPHIDGRTVRFEAETDNARKRELLSTAKCVLAPLSWPEPFGLFMVEAMACGTPVIAMNNGAAPEVIADRQTGFIVDSPSEMARMVPMTKRISPATCRRWVATNFDYPVMVDNYLRVYGEITNKAAVKGELEAAPRVRRNATPTSD